jgi:hypothetical protein
MPQNIIPLIPNTIFVVELVFNYCYGFISGVYDESLRRGRYVFSGDFSESPSPSTSSGGWQQGDSTEDPFDDSGVDSEGLPSPLKGAILTTSFNWL